MIVRIRWNQSAFVPSTGQKRLALLLAALLTPSALLAFSMAFWVIAADLRWTGDFFLTSGLFAHWQVWLYMAAVLLLVSRLLDRWAGQGAFAHSLENRAGFGDSIEN